MKMSNFQLTESGKSRLGGMAYATISIKKFPWSKIKTEKIAREYLSDWYFVDSGKFVPGHAVEDLARAW